MDVLHEHSAAFCRFDPAVSMLFAIERSVPLPFSQHTLFHHPKPTSVMARGKSTDTKAREGAADFATKRKCPENASLWAKVGGWPAMLHWVAKADSINRRVCVCVQAMARPSRQHVSLADQHDGEQGGSHFAGGPAQGQEEGPQHTETAHRPSASVATPSWRMSLFPRIPQPCWLSYDGFFGGIFFV